MDENTIIQLDILSEIIKRDSDLLEEAFSIMDGKKPTDNSEVIKDRYFITYIEYQIIDKHNVQRSELSYALAVDYVCWFVEEYPITTLNNI